MNSATISGYDPYDQHYESNPFIRILGIKTVEFEEGRVITELSMTPDIRNARGFVHGGVYATMLDHIIGKTGYSLVNCPVSTIDLNTHFIKNITEGKLIATATILHQGYKIFMGEGEVRDEYGNLLAKGIGSFKIIRNP
jgi:uncharacterized protein (TIGR00369 family)